MSGEDAPRLEDWYPELIHSLGHEEVDATARERALQAVRMAMGGVERAIAAGLITGVQISFEIPGEPPQGFNFSSEE